MAKCSARRPTTPERPRPVISTAGVTSLPARRLELIEQSSVHLMAARKLRLAYEWRMARAEDVDEEILQVEEEIWASFRLHP